MDHVRVTEVQRFLRKKFQISLEFGVKLLYEIYLYPLWGLLVRSDKKNSTVSK
jgi:hypothetical protein